MEGRVEQAVAASAPGGAIRTLSCSGCQNATVSSNIKGSYTQSGMNHQKPVFKRDGPIGQHGVLIYFWDDRNGPTFHGWWFGPAVGGDEVWAFNSNATSPTPPLTGWQVPWDGNIDQTLRLTVGGATFGRKQAGAEAKRREEMEAKRREEEARRREELEEKRR